jgi:hypothetical protein
VKIHRAVTLAVMIVLALLLIGWATLVGVTSIDSRSLASLAFVLVAAAIAGAAFSWRRYFPSRRR